jgi:hypothetical protein
VSRHRRGVDGNRRCLNLSLKSNLLVYPAIPSLDNNDKYASLIKNCITHIKAQDCPVKILEPVVSPPYSGTFEVGTKDRLVAITDRLNWLVTDFLKSKATHMWLIDADIEVPAHALRKLISLNTDLASGIYAFHNDRHIFMFGRMQDGDKVQFIPRGPPGFKGSGVIGDSFRVAGGNGCLLIRRRVLEQFHPDYAPLKFYCPVTEKRTWASDIFFWYQAQQFGFSARIHGGVLCGHLPQHPLQSYIGEYGADNIPGFERVSLELEQMNKPNTPLPS